MGFTLAEPPAIQRFIVTPSGFSFRSVAPLPSHAETTSPSYALTRMRGRWSEQSENLRLHEEAIFGRFAIGLALGEERFHGEFQQIVSKLRSNCL